MYSGLLTIRANNLGRDATLMLTFDNPISGMYTDVFPVCWKVARFGKSGEYTFPAEFHDQLVFSKPQVDNYDTIADAGTYVPIHLRQQTTLNRDAGGTYSFTTPEGSGSDSIKAYNGTQQEEGMAVGIVASDRRPTPVLYYPRVGAGSFAEANFVPSLSIYITSEYQEGQIIRGQVSASDIFQGCKDLRQLPSAPVWDLNYNPATEKFQMRLCS